MIKKFLKNDTKILKNKMKKFAQYAQKISQYAHTKLFTICSKLLLAILLFILFCNSLYATSSY